MTASLKASSDGTQAIIQVGGVDKLTIASSGTVSTSGNLVVAGTVTDNQGVLTRAASAKLKAVSGRYYLPPGVAISVNGMSAATTTGKIWFMPLLVGADATYTAICTHLQSAVASKVVRLGIYSDSNGVPGSRVIDAGTVSTATIGTKEITINQALTAGWYWLAFISDATATAVWSSYTASNVVDFGLGTSFLDGAAVTTNDFYVGYYGTQAYGALPSTPPALTAVKSSNAALPLVALKG